MEQTSERKPEMRIVPLEEGKRLFLKIGGAEALPIKDYRVSGSTDQYTELNVTILADRNRIHIEPAEIRY